MSTNAMITIKLKENSFKGIRVLYDGNIDYTGVTLLNDFNTNDTVLYLINKGNIIDITKNYYDLSLDSKPYFFKDEKSIVDTAKAMFIDNIYLFKDNIWFFYRHDYDMFVLLTEDLIKKFVHEGN